MGHLLYHWSLVCSAAGLIANNKQQTRLAFCDAQYQPSAVRHKALAAFWNNEDRGKIDSRGVVVSLILATTVRQPRSICADDEAT